MRDAVVILNRSWLSALFLTTKELVGTVLNSFAEVKIEVVEDAMVPVAVPLAVLMRTASALPVASVT